MNIQNYHYNNIFNDDNLENINEFLDSFEKKLDHFEDDIYNNIYKINDLLKISN